MGVLMSGSILVGVLNIVLAAVLLVVYRGVFSRTRASFSLALLFFALAFLAQNVLVVYAFVTMMSLVPAPSIPISSESAFLRPWASGRCFGPRPARTDRVWKMA